MNIAVRLCCAHSTDNEYLPLVTLCFVHREHRHRQVFHLALDQVALPGVRGEHCKVMRRLVSVQKSGHKVLRDASSISLVYDVPCFVISPGTSMATEGQSAGQGAPRVCQGGHSPSRTAESALL